MKYHYVHFTDKETKVSRVQGSCPCFHSLRTATIPTWVCLTSKPRLSHPSWYDILIRGSSQKAERILMTDWNLFGPNSRGNKGSKNTDVGKRAATESGTQAAGLEGTRGYNEERRI